MHLIYHCIFFAAGAITCAFTIVNALIVLFFGIPYSIKLYRGGMLKSSAPLMIQLASFIFSSSIFTIVFWSVKTYFYRYSITFDIGALFVVLISLGKVGNNKNNLSDFNELFKDKIINNKIKIDPENKYKINLSKKDVAPQPKKLSEQSMRPGYILFISSNSFDENLKMISTKNEPKEEIKKLTDLSNLNNNIKAELLIKTGNIELMAHDLDEMLKKYKHSSLTGCYAIGKEELKSFLTMKKINFKEIAEI